MAKKAKASPSPQVVAEAERIAKANQRPGQTKEQTKLIAQGIQKGIEQYKKQHKAKQRESDKAKKKARKPELSQAAAEEVLGTPQNADKTGSTKLPWALLLLSWILFAAYLWLG